MYFGIISKKHEGKIDPKNKAATETTGKIFCIFLWLSWFPWLF